MGCHTWFSVPFLKGKENIIKLAQKKLNENPYISESYKKMYQYAIDEELEDPVLELVSEGHSEPWILYKDISEYSLAEYNRANNTNIEKYSPEYNRIKIESYSNEPRISGYPNNVIRSYEDMISFMETGFIDDENKHHVFRLDEDRKEYVMNSIKRFFSNHPEGIITFG